jgi:hypothetical protein
MRLLARTLLNRLNVTNHGGRWNGLEHELWMFLNNGKPIR